MQFSDTTNKNGIIQNIESLCNLADAAITGNTTLFLKITGFVNNTYNKVALAILQADKKWKWDDFNYTDFPRGAATLVSGQQDYTLPAATTSGNAATLLGVHKIAVLTTDSQERTLRLTNKSEAQLNNEHLNTTGLPTVYKLLGNSLKMWPSPDSASCTLTSGLIVYFGRTPTQFTTSSTTAQPGFTSAFHELLQLEASAQYLLPTKPKLAATYMALYISKLNELLDAYPHMNEDNENKIVMRRRSSR